MKSKLIRGNIKIDLETEKKYEYRKSTHEYKKLIKLCSDSADFLISYTDINFSRGFSRANIFRFTDSILESLAYSFKVISSSLHLGAITEYYSITRNIQNGLLLNLHLSTLDQELVFFENRNSHSEEYLASWFKDIVRTPNYKKMIEKLLTNEEVKKFWKIYNFKDRTENLKESFNDYVHMNSFRHTTKKEMDFEKKLTNHYDNLFSTLKSIMIQFIGSIAIINPILLTSTDYIDYLDFGINPEENSQYWVAPFFVNFLEIYDTECMKYLEKQTWLIFNPN